MIYIRFRNGDEYRVPVNRYHIKECAFEYVTDWYRLD